MSKDGEVLGHILGTIHMNDEKVTKLDKKVMDIFDNSVGYSIEALPSSHLWNPYPHCQCLKMYIVPPNDPITGLDNDRDRDYYNCETDNFKKPECWVCRWDNSNPLLSSCIQLSSLFVLRLIKFGYFVLLYCHVVVQ